MSPKSSSKEYKERKEKSKKLIEKGINLLNKQDYENRSGESIDKFYTELSNRRKKNELRPFLSDEIDQINQNILNNKFDEYINNQDDEFERYINEKFEREINEKSKLPSTKSRKQSKQKGGKRRKTKKHRKKKSL